MAKFHQLVQKVTPKKSLLASAAVLGAGSFAVAPVANAMPVHNGSADYQQSRQSSSKTNSRLASATSLGGQFYRMNDNYLQGGRGYNEGAYSSASWLQGDLATATNLGLASQSSNSDTRSSSDHGRSHQSSRQAKSSSSANLGVAANLGAAAQSRSASHYHNNRAGHSSHHSSSSASDVGLGVNAGLQASQSSNHRSTTSRTNDRSHNHSGTSSANKNNDSLGLNLGLNLEGASSYSSQSSNNYGHRDGGLLGLGL